MVNKGEQLMAEKEENKETKKEESSRTNKVKKKVNGWKIAFLVLIGII